jgi:hypothetical protein
VLSSNKLISNRFRDCGREKALNTQIEGKLKRAIIENEAEI